MTAQTVTDSTFSATIAGSDLPVLVDFWAPWCGPCRQMSSIVDWLAGEYGHRIRVLKCNTDESPAAAALYAVTSLPTLLVLVDSEPVRTLVGAQSRRRILQELAEWLE